MKNLAARYPQLQHDLNFIHILEEELIYSTEDDDLIQDYHTHLLLQADIGRVQSATAEQRYIAILKTITQE